MSNNKAEATHHTGKEPWIMGAIEEAAQRPHVERSWEDIVSPTQSMEPEDPKAVPHAHLDEH